MKTAFVWAASLTLLCGCFSMGHPIKQANLAKIQRGVSTRADVEALLGKPEAVSFSDGPEGRKTVLQYLYSYSAVKGTTFIPYAGPFMGGMNTSSQSTTITLDTNNVVISIVSSNSAVEGGNNLEARSPDSAESTNGRPRTASSSVKPANR